MHTQVVRAEAVGVPADFLLCGDAIIGARYADEEYEGQAVFTAFALLQASRFLLPLPRRALVLGLGAGAVNEALLHAGVPAVDTVELVPEVVEAAAMFFGFQQYPAGIRGSTTFVRDAAEVLFAEPAYPQGYDLIVHDMYAGANPTALLSQQLFRRIRDSWLSERGVLWVNFIGYDSPLRGEKSRVAYPLTKAIVTTLQSLYAEVGVRKPHTRTMPFLHARKTYKRHRRALCPSTSCCPSAYAYYSSQLTFVVTP